MGGKSGGSQPIESREERTGRRNPITWYRQQVGRYPSNVQTWWAMKRPVQATPDNLSKQYLEVFDPEMRDQITFGNTLAPKGHYIFNAFQMDRSGVSGVGGLPVERTGQRPKTTAFFAGRIFYAGVQDNKWNTRVYFSQILERPDQAGACHQAQDPTSEDVPDLTPADGGVIVIPEIAEIIRMHALGGDLWIFATNGVWRIAGSEGIGFTASDYSISKHSSAPAHGPLTFVEIEGGLLWWSRSGIWALAPDETGMNMVVQSLSDNSIKAFFDEIPDDSKKYAKGAYNSQTKIVQWIYRSTPPETVRQRYEYDRILNLDTRTGAFYPWQPIADDFPRVTLNGIFAVSGEATMQENLPVVVGDAEVFSDGEQVFSPYVFRQSVENRFKYLVIAQEIV